MQYEHEAGRLRNQGKGLEANEKYQLAKTLYIKNGKVVQAAGCQLMIGVGYKIENNLKKAIAAYEEALKLYEKSNDPLGPGRVYRDIGIVYEYHDCLAESEQYLLQSKDALEIIPDETTPSQFGDVPTKNAELGITLAKLGLIYIRLKKFSAAEHHLIEGLTLIRRAGHPFYELTALLHLGALYYATKHFGRMMANAEAALGIIYEHQLEKDHTRRLAQVYGMLAHGFLHHANHLAATHYAQKAFAILETFSEGAKKPILKDIDAPALKQQLHL